MAAMTFLNQQDKLSRLLGDSNTDTDSAWPLVDRKFEINRGEKQFARDSKSLIAFATGTVSGSSITVPSDWVETFVLTVNNTVVTNDFEVSLTEFERFNNISDKHFYYWVDASDNKLLNFFDSTNNGLTYNLYYFKIPTTDLSADADESKHADEYRESSVYYAASELLEQLGKTAMSDRYRLKYQFFVDKAREEAETKYVNKQKAMPDIGAEETQFDKDVQGIGTVSDGIF